MMRLLLVSAGALATVALSTGTAHADTGLVGNVAKQAHAVVKSTHQTVHRAPAKAAAPVRHTVSTVAKAGRQVAAPIQRVTAPRNSSAVRPATTVHRLAKSTPTQRIVQHAPAKKVVRLAVKPVRAVAGKTSAVKTPAVKLPKIVKTASLLTTIDRELLGPVVTSPLLDPVLDPVLTPVLHVVAPVLETVTTPLQPIISAPLPASPPVAPVVSGPIRSVPGLTPGMSTAAAPVSNGPTPNVSGVGSTSSRPGLVAVAGSVVAHAVDEIANGSGPVVLGSLGSLVVIVAVGAGATGTASAGSAGAAAFALLERGLLGAAATSNPRFGDGTRSAPWALAKHPGFAPD